MRYSCKNGPIVPSGSKSYRINGALDVINYNIAVSIRLTQGQLKEYLREYEEGGRYPYVKGDPESIKGVIVLDLIKRFNKGLISPAGSKS